jgi:hypothetical protein
MSNKKNQQPLAQPVKQTAPLNPSQIKPAFPKSTMALDSAVQVRPAFPKRTMVLESFDPKTCDNKKSGK